MSWWKRARHKLRRIGFAFLDLLYPPHCYLCGKPLDNHSYICSTCLDSIPLLEEPYCQRCGEPLVRNGLCELCSRESRGFFLARSASSYLQNSRLARAIRGFKYQGERALARDLIRLFLRGKTCKLLKEAAALTYVPQTRSKRASRGFNQGRLLAEQLGDQLGLPVIQGLEKIRETPPQVDLDRETRMNNLDGAFRPQSSINFDPLVLVDDVFTTGATASECAKTLNEAGPSQVNVVTLARSLPVDRAQSST